MNEIDNIISHYLMNDITDDELNALHAWLQESEDNRNHFRMMCDAWNISNLQGDMADFNPDDAFHIFKRKTAIHTPLNKKRYLTPFRIAASLFIICALTVLIIIFRQPGTVTLYAGQDINNIILPDSSRVWLKSGTISYNKRFGTKERSVVLNGEALFDVRKLHDIPFTVNTESARIVVLGTRFQVLYEMSGNTSVFVKSGKVKVFASSNPDIYKVVSPNQLAVINKYDTISLVTQRTELNKTAWFTRELYFANESLPEVLKSIEENSSKIFIIQDQDLFKEYFSGTILLDSADSYCNLLRTLYDIRIESKGDSIFIYK